MATFCYVTHSDRCPARYSTKVWTIKELDKLHIATQTPLASRKRKQALNFFVVVCLFAEFGGIKFWVSVLNERWPLARPPGLKREDGASSWGRPGCRLWAVGHCSNGTRELPVPTRAVKDGAVFIEEDGEFNFSSQSWEYRGERKRRRRRERRRKRT